jgi:hypothetical protein
MWKLIVSIIIILLFMYLWYSSEHFIRLPNGTLKYDTTAIFPNDRSWFENNEGNYYSRYTT